MRPLISFCARFIATTWPVPPSSGNHLLRPWPPVALALCLMALLPAGGCVYKVNIQQGNFLEGRTVDQLQVGMTRSQVRYLLGTPMVPDAFDKERWDYLYYFKKGRWHRAEERHLIVLFKEEKVDKIEKINVPDKPPNTPDQGPSVQKFPVI
jgi:outer membrane protein assembly factor BamE